MKNITAKTPCRAITALAIAGALFVAYHNPARAAPTAAEGGADTFAINYTEVNKLFWYGGFNLALQYIF